ncbi:MAG: DUF4299 family protein [Oscillospiraceae bacterium]|nr:DUF4299 family protein [Oscillospiraceae bacterium]MBR5722356.1 DUF4299 family protein [Oscillospiraceae bacterium]
MAENRYVGENADWTTAFVADPHFYRRPDGTPFGVFAINEGIETILPKLPQARYQVNGKQVDEWRILLYSKTKGDVIGDTDFYAAMRKLVTGGYILDDNGENVLVQALTLTELDALMR